VLLHGGPGFDHSDYKPHLSSLADHAQLVYLDHLGQGRSDPSDPSRWNLTSWATAVRDFCDTLEIERPVVLGASFGSFVALRYAIDYPEHPSKLILMATGARMNLKLIGETMERFGGKRPREVAQRFLTEPNEQTMTEYIEVCLPLYQLGDPDHDAHRRAVQRLEVAYHFYGGEGVRFDHREGAAGVRCPVLVINGDRDPITPIEGAHELVQALPPHLAELVTIEGTAHELHEALDQVMPPLRRFITS
jgi:pimeloyl-ACP methyl ester carboxylesterase